MTTDWSLPEVARSYEDYDPVRERAFAYPVMFGELGLTDPAYRRVLDYGCGTGRVAERMVRELGASVVAADPSPGMLEVARQLRTHPDITYQLIGDDQRLDIADNAVDAAVSCFVFVCISEAERIQRIVSEVYRLLRPGATYAMLELNPDMVGVPFQIGVMGEAGRQYGAGEPIEIRLSTPGAEPMAIVDYHWPKQTQVGFLEAAGFRNVRVQEPTLPAEYDGPGADRMVVERMHPPYTIYLAQK